MVTQMLTIDRLATHFGGSPSSESYPDASFQPSPLRCGFWAIPVKRTQ
jgi:hypothetical protein